jgi:enterochelin esterase family protein
MIAISIGNGGGDAQGSQRGLEYDTMSGTSTPSSSRPRSSPWSRRSATSPSPKTPTPAPPWAAAPAAACAIIMAWYRPDLYHRVLSFSGTFVNQQWPHNPDTPHGAWGLHETLIPKAPPSPSASGCTSATATTTTPTSCATTCTTGSSPTRRMAKVLAAKGYPYQFVFARNAAHCDRAVKAQTLPLALEYLWQDYRKK